MVFCDEVLNPEEHRLSPSKFRLLSQLFRLIYSADLQKWLKKFRITLAKN